MHPTPAEPQPPGNRTAPCHAALASGAWATARACYEAALAEQETAELVEALSWATWWLGDTDATLAGRERAYRLYSEANDRPAAARMAMWAATDSIDFRGEPAVASGWQRRARRLLEGLEPVPEHGWLALHEGGFALDAAGDVAAAQRLGAEAAACGRRFGVVDLEMLGLALEGLALVSEGRVEDGMQRLDEAAAAALAGDFQELFAIAWACCFLIYGCEHVRDYDRAAQWCARMREFGERYQVRFAIGVCRAHYAGVLMWRGTWPEAESELTLATEDLAASRPAMVAEGIVRLGELRRRQGRDEEAAALFTQAESHPHAFVGRAELALQRDDAEQAEDLLQQLLRHLSDVNRLARSAALELLVRVRAARGDHAGAAAALEQLREIAEAAATRPLQAAFAFARGIVMAATGDYAAARDAFQDAALLFEKSGGPFESARARLELAGVLARLGRLDMAVREARTAQAALERIGAAHEQARATRMLRRLRAGARAQRPGRRAGLELTRREAEVLSLIAEGLTDRDIATRLFLSEHTVHRHVSNILLKLKLPSRAAAVAHAARHDLI